MHRLATLGRSLSSVVDPSALFAATRSFSAAVAPEIAMQEPGFWKMSPLDPSRPLFERSARECLRNLVHLMSDNHKTRVGILERLFTKYVVACAL
jgi:hypothetical protein